MLLKYEQLYKYQIKAVNYILEKKKCALFLGMGIGKTVISLTAASLMFKEGLISKVLVIAPLGVAQTVWDKEILAWEHLKHLKYSLVLGNENVRFEKLKEISDIYIINRENLLWLFINGYRNFDLIIVDESTSFKNPSRKGAKLFKNLDVYNKVKHHFNNCSFTKFTKYKINKFVALTLMQHKYLVELSGTPAPNGLEGLYSQLYIIDRGLRLGKSFSKYVQSFFIKNDYSYVPINPELIFEKISDITMSMLSEDYLELPEKVLLTTEISLNEHLKTYKNFIKEFVINLEGENLSVANGGVLRNKLLQFCNGAIYDSSGSYKEIHNFKLDALETLIEANQTENIIVAYSYKSDLDRIKKRLPTAVVLDKQFKLVDDWNKGKIKILLCHPASAGKGLNLQQGGRIIIWFGLTWNLEDYLQFNGRLHRLGQTKSVIINHIIAKEGIDSFVMKRLLKKELSQQDLLDYLKLEME